LPDIASFGLYMVVFLFSLSVHEAAHAWVAERFGDPTGRLLGRVTLNPLPHIDVLGTLIFPAVGYFSGGVMFGWAKPVPWNPLNVKDRRQADIGISAAGPLSNLVLMAAFIILLKILQGYYRAGGEVLGGGLEPIYHMCVKGIQINFVLALFNILPIPPLDGSWILPHFLPTGLARSYERLRPYGFLVLLLFVCFGLFGMILTPFWRMVLAII
jgi:Zn-dependent protease